MRTGAKGVPELRGRKVRKAQRQFKRVHPRERWQNILKKKKNTHSRLVEDAFFSVCAPLFGTERQKPQHSHLFFFLLVFVCFFPHSGPTSRHTSFFFICSVLNWWNDKGTHRQHTHTQGGKTLLVLSADSPACSLHTVL